MLRWLNNQSSLPINPTSPSELPIQSQNRFVSTEIYLSDLAWSSMSNGWGPAERDRSNGERGSQDGQPISLDGHTYAKGLGVHADSEVHYALNGACTTFSADIGVDDEAGNAGSVVFRVWADEKLLFESGIMKGVTGVRTVTVAITGARDLALIVTDGGDSPVFDHANWADARLTCADDGLMSRQ
jgi:alpha-galactosidase